jgi:hypothetical protein
MSEHLQSPQTQKKSSKPNATHTQSLGNQMQKTIRKKIYRWHRILGLFAIIPTLFWTASGIMHPFMSHWFKTKIAKESYQATPVLPTDVQLTLHQVLTQANIKEFKNFRLVQFNGQCYYQVKDIQDKLLYFDAVEGKQDVQGDQKYAEQMARYMLDDFTSPIASITQIKEFTDEYKFVNRLLPVWKVSFSNDRDMDVYVETEFSRFVTFNDGYRKKFIWIFSTFHNWGFLDGVVNDTLRISLMVLFLSFIILSTLAGIIVYGLMWKKFKPAQKHNKQSILRTYHRSIGIWTSIVTCAFAFSGAYHVIQKLTPDERLKYVYDPILKTAQIEKAALFDLKGVSNVSIIKWGENLFWQLVKKDEETNQTTIEYIHTQDGTLLEDGNHRYAQYLARKFAAQEARNAESCCDLMESKISSSISDAVLQKASLVTRFAGEYGFVNKRLPVVKLEFDTPENTTYYIETTTSRLSTKVEDSNRREGFTFAFLHKYSGLDFAGKNIRDGVMTLAAMGVLLVSILGLLVFIKIK